MKAILFDLDGVLYEGERALAGAAEVVAWVRKTQIPHAFLTNTTSRPRAALVAKLGVMGIAVSEEELFTPAQLAMRWLQQAGSRRVALFVTESSAGEFQEFECVDDESPVDAVVVGDLGTAWDFTRLNHAFRLLMQEPPPHLLALAMTRFWQGEEGLRLDAGPFIRALEYASGREAVVMGKPAADFFATALRELGVAPQHAVMVGDDIRGDIEGAQRAGMTALLVRTGKFRASDLGGEITPDGVLDSVAALPDWWRRYSGSNSSPT